MRESNEESKKPESWERISDLFSSVIVPAIDWADADCLGDINDMAVHFRNAFPDQNCDLEGLQLALHDMKIPFERNEHNNKFYYLAKWR